MKKIKRWMVSLTALSMLGLTACGGGGQPANNASPEPAKPAESTPAAAPSGGKKVIEYWYIDPAQKEEVYLEAVKRFTDKHPDVEVKALHIPNDAYKQKLSVAMSGGNPPDVFHSWGGGWLKEFVQGGKVLDITGKIDASHFNPLALGNATFDNKVHGLPLGISLTQFWYNKEIFAKYNLQPPTTWDEFKQVITTLKENKIIPIALTNKTKWPGAYYLMYLADRQGDENLFLEAFNRTGRGFDDPDYVKAGQYIQELVDLGAFNPGFNGVPYDAGQGRQLVYSGQAAMMLMSNSFLNNTRQEAPDFEKNIDFFTFPTLPGGKGDASSLGASSAPVWSVSTTSKNPDLAVELIKELTSLETAQAYADRTASPTAINGVKYNDAFASRLVDIMGKAKAMHFPYDQTLPPELAELHKDTTQSIFGKTMTPEEAAKQMEAKAKEVLK
ncbi:ABC transporter substrate-binding protein [Ammoniphilus sp. YIM 78166]|uniref:ABC transporter substrate-binding protein n=1 Tax=Ammoniphilus sp. YIM 78166 TaxID=1644106 RepID=UPI001F0E6E63|nr:extracellular solute-binding protein [Ammoniphilus sp. YIM 78166]